MSFAPVALWLLRASYLRDQSTSAAALPIRTLVRSSARSSLWVPCRRPSVEAVDTDQLAGAGDVDVALWARIPRRLVGCGITCEEAEALGAGTEAVAGEHLPNPVGETTMPPSGTGQLRGDSLGAQAGMAEREGDDPLLDHLRADWASAAPVALLAAVSPAHGVDGSLPGVGGRAVHPEASAGLRDARAGGLGKERLAVAVSENLELAHLNDR